MVLYFLGGGGGELEFFTPWGGSCYHGEGLGGVWGGGSFP